MHFHCLFPGFVGQDFNRLSLGSEFYWLLTAGRRGRFLQPVECNKNIYLKLNKHFPNLIAMSNRDKKDRTVGRCMPEVYSMHPCSNCQHTIIDRMNLLELAVAIGDVVFGELLCIPLFNGWPTGKDT